MVASRGGLPVIPTVLAGLPQTFPVPVLVMQHRPGSTDPGTLPRLLGRSSAMPVHCAAAGKPPGWRHNRPTGGAGVWHAPRRTRSRCGRARR
jgi:two-component system chemotaxis response regulator CheB